MHTSCVCLQSHACHVWKRVGESALRVRVCVRACVTAREQEQEQEQERERVCEGESESESESESGYVRRKALQVRCDC